jgi:hypothetical protein
LQHAGCSDSTGKERELVLLLLLLLLLLLSLWGNFGGVAGATLHKCSATQMSRSTDAAQHRYSAAQMQCSTNSMYIKCI